MNKVALNYQDITVVHMLPDNLKVCGGVKVHYQLSKLITDLGLQSFIAFPSSIVERPAIKWFEHDRFEISYEQVRAWYKNKRKLLLIGWEDPDNLLEFENAYKVSYIQGFSFLQDIRKYYTNGITLWISSKANLDAVLYGCAQIPELKGVALRDMIKIVRPFIDFNVFYANSNKKIFSKSGSRVKILIQERKGGREVVACLKKYLLEKEFKKLDFIILPEVTEVEFAKKLREVDIFIAHSFPEGLGLPVLEAMASRVLVVGFSGRGGDEFFQHNITGLKAVDGDYKELAQRILEAIGLLEVDYGILIYNAELIARTYTRESTALELKEGLKDYAIV